MNKYKVEFDIKAHNHLYCYEAIVTAENAKRARELCEHAWYVSSKSHMFHIDVHRIGKTDDSVGLESMKVVGKTW